MNTDSPELGVRGKAFYLQVVAGFDLRIDELEILVELCRTLDLIETLSGEPVTVELAREQRMQRAELRHQIASLSLPDPLTGEVVESGNTRRARAAATAKHAKGK